MWNSNQRTIKTWKCSNVEHWTFEKHCWTIENVLTDEYKQNFINLNRNLQKNVKKMIIKHVQVYK